MPPENKPAPREAGEQQERSIKERKHHLFEEPQRVETGAVKPFSVYLRDTPPAPMSTPVKAALWTVGVLAVLLLLAALLSGGRRPPRPKVGAQTTAPVAVAPAPSA